LIRGDCWKSLSRHASLSADSYSALLLAAELVRIKGNSVCLSIEKWKEFIVTYGLAPRGKQSCGISEICYGGVLVETVKKRHRDDPPINKNGTMKQLHMLRIGKYEEGSTITPTKQINNETPPPSFNHKLRTIQRAFLLKVRPIISKFWNDERVATVMAWVLMEELTEDTSPTKAKEPTANITTQTLDSTQTPTKPKQPTASITAQTLGDSTPTPTPTKENEPTATITPQSVASSEYVVGDADLYSPSEDGKIDISDEIAREFPLLSKCNLMLFDNDFDKKSILIQKEVNRQALLRESVLLSQRYGQRLSFVHNRWTHNLVDVGDVMGNSYHWIKDLCDEAGVENVVRCFVGHLFTFQREQFVHELQSLSAIPKIFDGLVEEDITCLISYLCDCYPEMMHDEMRRRKIVHKKMDEFSIAALIQKSNIKISQWKVIVRCLKLYLDVDNFLCV
jgi:hypothetical protein